MIPASLLWQGAKENRLTDAFHTSALMIDMTK